MRRFRLIGVPIFIVMLVAVQTPAFADSFSDTIAKFRQSPMVQPFFESSYAFAVFPTVGKGGLIFGLTYGRGKVYRGGTPTGTVQLNKMSAGLQIGGQAFSEVVFLEDERAYNEFTKGNFEFDFNASAVAITVGAQARAGTMGSTAGASAGPSTGKQAGIQYYKGMAVFVHAKGGLMLEAAIGGQKFVFEPYQ